jgi:hypothetical protein
VTFQLENHLGYPAVEARDAPETMGYSKRLVILKVIFSLTKHL